jgi:hypothetical protein
MERQVAEDGTFTILWYEPQMRQGEADNLEEFHRRYSSCLNQSWIPSYEPKNRILVDSIITAWTNSVGLSNVTTVNGVRTKKKNHGTDVIEVSSLATLGFY